jgi:outer membrane immunogenic protein
MMRLLLGAAAALALAMSTPVCAADMPLKAAQFAPAVAPQFNWTGWYVGLNAGGAWGRSDPGTTTVVGPGGYFVPSSPPAIAAAGAQGINSSGFTGGGQAGYNWQSGRVVFGLEADVGYLGLNGSASTFALYPCCAPFGFTVNSSVRTDWTLTFRPRAGFTIDHWLVYATGGIAASHLTTNFGFVDTTASIATESASIANTRAGWVAGGGAEYALQGPWSIRLEYLHVDLGTMSTTSTNMASLAPLHAYPTNVFGHSVNLRSEIVRFGVNYRL